jgi:hypothetical protein
MKISNLKLHSQLDGYMCLEPNFVMSIWCFASILWLDAVSGPIVILYTVESMPVVDSMQSYCFSCMQHIICCVCTLLGPK